jgi:hypothetical protein
MLFEKLRARYGDHDDLVEETRQELQACEERESQMQALLESQVPPATAMRRSHTPDGRFKALL